MPAATDHGTTRDGLIQLRRRWQPDTARAAILLIHGIGEHGGRYEHVGDRFASAGFDVVCVDNRGFGQSGGRRGHIDNWSEYLDDVEDQLAEVRSLGLPTAMVGHSLGGLIATSYCLDGRPLPDALMISGPALGVEMTAKYKAMKAIGPILRRLAPHMEFREPWDPTLYAEDVTVGETFEKDPLRVDFATLSLGIEVFSAMQGVESRLPDLSIPTLCFHGGRDKLVAVEGSAGLESVELAERRVLDELGHEIFNEPVGLELVDDVVAWLEGTLDLTD